MNNFIPLFNVDEITNPCLNFNVRSCIALMMYFQVCAGHYNDVIMGAMASQITSLTIVNSNVYSGTDQRKYQSSASLAFV